MVDFEEFIPALNGEVTVKNGEVTVNDDSAAEIASSRSLAPRCPCIPGSAVFISCAAVHAIRAAYSVHAYTTMALHAHVAAPGDQTLEAFSEHAIGPTFA